MSSGRDRARKTFDDAAVEQRGDEILRKGAPGAMVKTFFGGMALSMIGAETVLREDHALEKDPAEFSPEGDDFSFQHEVSAERTSRGTASARN